jgi:plasmid stability protein
MSIPITLPPDLEARLKLEATRRGLSPEACAAQVLDQHLPPATQAAVLQALFGDWEAEDKANEDDVSADEFFQALDEDRPSDRKLFPPELKGITW